jgi:hypothetical protein
VRKLISLSLGVALAATVFVVIPVSAEPAIVVSGGDCGLPAVNPAGEIVAGTVGTVSNSLRNDNGAKVTCKGESFNDSGRTQHFSGFGCFVSLHDEAGFVMTFDSHATITRNGMATMTCKAVVRTL